MKNINIQKYCYVVSSIEKSILLCTSNNCNDLASNHPYWTCRYVCTWTPNFSLPFIYTHGDKNLHTLLAKHYNDLLDGQSFEQSIDNVTYFYVGDLFCLHLGTKYANFQEKTSRIFLGESSKLCIEVTLLLYKVWNFLPVTISAKIFSWKSAHFSVKRVKVYTKNVPNIEVFNFIPAPSITLTIKQVIVVFYLY